MTTRSAVSMLAAVAATVSVVAGCSTGGPHIAEQFTLAPATPTGDSARVVRVVDGDTLTVTAVGGQRITVRLIGVDTPETKRPNTVVQCYGPQAAALTTDLVRRDAAVRLEADPVAGGRDRYGRTLAYVWLPDGSMLNERLLAAGAAREYDFNDQPYRYRDRFRAAAAAARTDHAGLWAQC